MGKKTKPTPAKAAVALTPEASQKLAELQNEASQKFVAKDFAKALELYDQAAKLAPEGSEQKGDLCLKKAYCFLNLSKPKEAARECGSVLEASPASLPALRTRAKAFEEQGLFKSALSDIQQVNKSEGANDESREQEKRLKDRMKAQGGNKQVGKPSAAPSGAPPGFPYYLTAKCSLGSEVKLVHASLTVSYAELLAAVQAKFPNAGPILLKYLDKEGDLVTITSRQDVQTALTELAAAYQRQLQQQGGHGPRLNQATFPPLRITVSPVASNDDVPKPPAEEIAERIQAERQRLQKAAEEAAAQQPGAHPEGGLDDWLMDFMKLFTEHTGIDPYNHNEAISLGADKLAKAMDAALADDKAQTMFDKAADHFRDAVCVSLIQWGNVNMVRAERAALALVRAGKAVAGPELDKILGELDETEKKIQEAMRFKPDSWEAMTALAQLEFERLKNRLGFVLQPPVLDEAASAGKTPEALAAEQQAQLLTRIKALLGAIEPAKVKAVAGHIDKASTWFEKALAAAKVHDEARQKAEKEKEEAEGKTEEKPELTPEQKAAQSLATAAGNVLVMHGNILYEWSQILAGTNQEWRPVLDAGVAKFREAGAVEAEVRNALRNHLMKEQLDLGPDPEPTPAPAAAAPTEAAKAPEPAAAEAPKAAKAKGLPSLEVKGKKK